VLKAKLSSSSGYLRLGCFSTIPESDIKVNNLLGIALDYYSVAGFLRAGSEMKVG
jgi:hypothetical protein